MEEVKERQKPQSTRVSSKNQVTIPVAALRGSGLRAGDRVTVRADGPGRVLIEREEDIIAKYSGALTGVWEPGALDRLRDEWR
jgi:bifunctional DNA-binding transcriptional regulator/antitoxin component of YhaV-PrlF toxin-antitoxin module